MKKKFSVLLLIVLMLPLLALFGCGETTSFSFTFQQSCDKGRISGNGIQRGQGTFAEGSTVSITASADDEFIGWLFQGTTLLESNSTYTISETTDSSGKVKSSTLSFASNSATQGNYTAVFSEENIMYVKFDSLRLTTNADATTGVEDDGLQATLLNVNQITVSQGTANPMTNVYIGEDLNLKDNVYVRPETVNSVMKLTTKTDSINLPRQVNVVLRLTSSMQLNPFRTSLYFQTSEKTETSNVSYSNNTYDIKFTFSYQSVKYNLIVTYKTLGK